MLSIPKLFKINVQNFSPNIVWTIAKDNGIIKKIKVCLKRALFILCSSAPICLNILYLFLSSKQSDNSFKARIAEDEIKNIIPNSSADLYFYGEIVTDDKDWWTGEKDENLIGLQSFKEELDNLGNISDLNIYMNTPRRRSICSNNNM